MTWVLRKIRAQVEQRPGQEAIVSLAGDQPRRVSYRQLWGAIARAAERLRELGLVPGDRVALSGPNRPEWVAACLGAQLAGLTVAPLDPELGPEELESILSFLEPRAVLCARELAPRFQRPGAPLVELESLEPAPLDGPGPEPLPFPPDRPICILFTSGSTSHPKGVELTEANFRHNVEMLAALPGLIDHRDRVLALLPLHHVYPFTATVLLPLCLGAGVIYPRSLKGEDLAHAARQERATILVAVPAVLRAMHRRIADRLEQAPFFRRLLFRLLRKPAGLGIERGRRPGKWLFRPLHRRMPALRFIACGGAHLEAGLHRELAIFGFRVIEAYGLSETAPVAALNSLQRPVFGSVGKPAPGVEIRLEQFDPRLPDAEVLVRGPNVMRGYFRQPELTAAAFRDGWLRTGDLGRFDREGNLYLTGRSSEVIVMSSGKNVYPDELEERYLRRVPLAEELGIIRLEEGGRDLLAAVVHPSREALGRRRTSRIYEDIRFEVENAGRGLPAHQRVQRVILLEEPLPRTRLGKLRRWRIRELVEERRRSIGTEVPAGREPTGDPVLDFVAAWLKLDRTLIGRENLETDLELDSLAILDLVSAFERQFGLRLGEEQAAAVVTVGDLRRLAEETPPQARTPRPEDQPLEQVVDLPGGGPAGALRGLGRLKLGFLARVFYHGRLTGAERLPQPPFILAPNHLSMADGPLLFALLPRRIARETFFVATAEVFDRAPFSWITYPARVIRTGTLRTTASSVQYARELLRRGKVVCIFPEGKRSLDGRTDQPRPGIGRLAAELGVPIVPVRIEGTLALFSRPHPGLHLARIAVEVLPPLPPAGEEAELLGRWYQAQRAREEHGRH